MNKFPTTFLATTFLLASVTSSQALTIDTVAGTWSQVTTSTNQTYRADGGNVEGIGSSKIIWGEPYDPYGRPYGSGKKSGLEFTGNNPVSFEVEQVFKLGTLTHFNYPVGRPTATSAELEISLSFSDPLGLESDLDFSFAINETPNRPGYYDQMGYWHNDPE